VIILAGYGSPNYFLETTLTDSVAKLLHRYSLGIKHLSEPGPSDSELAVFTAAALRAPDHAELIPFRFVAVRGEARERLASIFEQYARDKGKDAESCALERERALRAPVIVAVVARIDMHHPVVPTHEQWACVGGAITNFLNAAHFSGFAGKMLSGEKVRDTKVVSAFCSVGEVLVGWISLGTAATTLSTNKSKNPEAVLSFF
jgi:nitroreductase